MNRVHLSGELIEMAPLRYTPAGLAVLTAKLHHVGTVLEASSERKIVFDMPFTAIGEIASAMSQLEEGSAVRVDGFIAPKSLKTSRLSLHVTAFTKGV